MKITTRYLSIASMLMLAAAALVGWALFMIFYQSERTAILDSLERSVVVESRQHGIIFQGARRSQQQAIDAFKTRLSAWSKRNDLDERFEATFQHQTDGTYRSYDRDFDGTLYEDGLWVYGTGAFIAPGIEQSPQRKAQLLAAYDIVTRFGDASHFWADNFYFYTPYNDVIIFAPGREDRLEFYRKTAPADFNFQDKDVGKHVTPGANPNRLMKCTGLENVMYDRSGVRLTSGCQTPVDIVDQHVGAFGVSFLLNGWLSEAIANPIEGAKPFIIQSDGEMIAHEELIDRSGGVEQAKQFAAELRANLLVASISETGENRGTLYFAPWQSYVAFSKIAGPDWYFIAQIPKARVRSSALASALPIAGLCLLMGLLLIVVSALVLRTVIATPLEKLAAEAGRDLSRQDNAAFSNTDRNDEIGSLARSFQERDERFKSLVASLDAKVKARTAEFEEARDSAELANSAKTSFLANMSHEIRTPLNAIVGMTQVLNRTSLREEDRRHLDIMRTASFSLLDVINSVLDLSKIESGTLEFENIPFSLEELTSSAVAPFEQAAKEKGVDFYVSIEDGAAGEYCSDPAKIKQIVTNLISNAVKFTQEGSVCITVAAEAGGKDARMLKFEIRDSGIGMTEDSLKRIFNPFMQADVSTTRKFGGTGLGLAISKRIAEGLGGEISAESAPDQGSCFTVSIPVTLAEKNSAAADESVYDKEHAQELLKSLSVLVAEDQEPNRMVMEAILKSSVKKLFFAKNGLEAVALWRQGDVDLILMDIQMPALDGVEATKKIRALEADKNLPRTPIIALTANAFTEQGVQYIASGMDAHLTKPIDFRALYETVAKCVAGKSKAA